MTDEQPTERELAEAALLRRRKLVVAGVLGAVAAIGVVAVVVLSVTLGHKSGDPTTPEGTAEQWATAVVRHDSGRQHDLECANTSSADVLQLVVPQSAPVEVGAAQRDGSNRWQVPVTIAGSTVTVGVDEQNGRYLVC